MAEAVAVAVKRQPDGRWLLGRHPGRVYFDLRAAGTPSRWNTLRALRVLNCGDDRRCMIRRWVRHLPVSGLRQVLAVSSRACQELSGLVTGLDRRFFR
jgi:hypothetical protein